jgi:hydrogenase small subunit
MSAPTVGEFLRSRGVTRRDFMRFCASATAVLGLPASLTPRIAAALEQAQRPSVIWLPFQECTGCTESITRAHGATLESLIFEAISLDYQHTLQAAAGEAAEGARERAMQAHRGRYLLIVDGSVPIGNPGYGTIAGRDYRTMLEEAAEGAAAIIALGT